MRAILIALVFLFGNLQIQPQNQAVLNRAHKSAYHTSQQTVVEHALCSATAIGPHALLTASHCEMVTSQIDVEGIDSTLHIDAILRDGNDHTIYLISGATFPTYSTLSESRKLDQGEPIFMFGNPGNWENIYRHGYVAGTIDDSGLFNNSPSKIAFDLKVYQGDSGSAIFDQTGRIIGVLTGTMSQGQGSDATGSITLSFSFPLKFTPAQIERARTYVPLHPYHAAAKSGNPILKILPTNKGR